jgi:autotransporter-associated beta strand protein
LASNTNLEVGKYMLIDARDGSLANRDATQAVVDSVTGLGAQPEDIVWEDGVLYVEQGKSIWTNAGGNGTWNTTSTNWSRNGLDITYRDGMDVLFDGTAVGTVQLEGDVAPLSVTVENAAGQDYTFAGSGKLTGATSLTKTGTGELSLATANEHTGGTVVDGGTLRVQHSTALGAADATVTTAAGTLLSVENNAAVVLASATGNSLAGRVQVQTGASLEVQGTGYHAEATQLEGELIFSGAG